jgi:dienelactone hydrolase
MLAAGKFAASEKLSGTEAPANCYAGQLTESTKLPGFKEYPFTCDSHTRPVFVTKSDGRSVLLLHEINGLSPACISLAKLLAKQQLRVYLPLLFGRPGMNSTAVGTLQSCFSSQFNCYTGGSSSPIVTWLRRLISNGIPDSDPGATKIGVVGMCLTGGFPISLMREPRVAAAVLSQPALPMDPGKEAEIDVVPEDLQFAEQRSDVEMLILRFACDLISTDARLKYLKTRFPRMWTYEVPCFHGFKAITHRQHAVLTAGQTINPAEFQKAFDLVVATLKR